jgi:hypothetical protein
MDRRAFPLLLITALLIIPALGRAQPMSEQMESDTVVETDTPVEEDASDSLTQFQLGWQAYRQGDLHEGIGRLERAMNADSTFSRARYWLGHFYYLNGRNDSAIQTWREHRPGADIEEWMERELVSHRRRYDSDTTVFNTQWEYTGFVAGAVHGEDRLTNPTAIEPAPGGGWYVSSYQLGTVVHYSTEGRVVDRYTGFGNPVDLHYQPGEGLLVVDGSEGDILRMSDTGSIEPWSQQAIPGAQKLLYIDRRPYLFNLGEGAITQLSSRGGTVASIWEAGPQRDINDVVVGPEDRFWVLDQSGPEVLVMDRYGRIERRLTPDRPIDLRRIWWVGNTLIGSGLDDFYHLDSGTLTPTPINTTGQSFPSGDVSDVHVEGNRVVLSLFEESGLGIYRMTEEADPLMLVQPLRPEFRKFPIVRLSMTINDPRKMNRYRHLQDQHLGIELDGQSVLPNLLRHSKDVYSAGWIMIVDNRMSESRWAEIQPRLIEFVSESPDSSRGSIWSVGDDEVLQGWTDRNVRHRNVLDRLSVTTTSDRADTALVESIGLALDTVFATRGAQGVIVVSNNLPSESERVIQLARRFKNNSVPLTVMHPTVEELPRSHPFRDVAPSRYFNLSNPAMDGAWSHYSRWLRSHYTAIFRSNLSYQQSNEWRPYQLIFEVYDQTYRYNGAYLMP